MVCCHQGGTLVRLNSLTTVKGPNNAQLELKHVFAPSQYLPRLLANNKIVVSMGDEYDLTFFSLFVLLWDFLDCDARLDYKVYFS